MPTRLLRPSKLLAFLLLGACAPTVATRPPPPAAPPFNQLAVSGNACGPAALLNAFRFGGSRWRSVPLPGSTDKERLQAAIRTHGLKPSADLRGRTRWSRAGINVIDLAAFGNDLTAPHDLPRLKERVLHPAPGESPDRAISLLSASLRHGFPPVVSLRRQVMRAAPGGTPAWITLDSHFITVLTLSPSENGAWKLDYLDPWGGRKAVGIVRPSEHGLEADLPSTPVGKRLVRPGETSTLLLSAAVGVW